MKADMFRLVKNGSVTEAEAVFRCLVRIVACLFLFNDPYDDKR